MTLRNFGAMSKLRAAAAVVLRPVTTKPQEAAALLRLSTTARGGWGQQTTTADLTKKFGEPSYWEKEYASHTELQPFEWFLPYDGGLRDHLLPVLKSTPSSCTRLLHVGCGTSEVGPQLAQEPGLSLHVTDADTSASAVRLMKTRYAALDNYTCAELNVLNLDFPEGSFDAVVDKGTLDALLCRSVEDAQEMVSEVHRVLSKGGVYVQISAEDPEVRLELLTRCSSSKGKGREPWSRTFFKELELGESSGIAYFMCVLIK